jgi:hypothetical protein
MAPPSQKKTTPPSTKKNTSPYSQPTLDRFKKVVQLSNTGTLVSGPYINIVNPQPHSTINISFGASSNTFSYHGHDNASHAMASAEGGGGDAPNIPSQAGSSGRVWRDYSTTGSQASQSTPARDRDPAPEPGSVMTFFFSLVYNRMHAHMRARQNIFLSTCLCCSSFYYS